MHAVCNTTTAAAAVVVVVGVSGGSRALWRGRGDDDVLLALGCGQRELELAGLVDGGCRHVREGHQRSSLGGEVPHAHAEHVGLVVAEVVFQQHSAPARCHRVLVLVLGRLLLFHHCGNALPGNVCGEGGHSALAGKDDLVGRLDGTTLAVFKTLADRHFCTVVHHLDLEVYACHGNKLLLLLLLLVLKVYVVVVICLLLLLGGKRNNTNSDHFFSKFCFVLFSLL